jgi:hypothetical protein
VIDAHAEKIWLVIQRLKAADWLPFVKSSRLKTAGTGRHRLWAFLMRAY